MFPLQYVVSLNPPVAPGCRLMQRLSPVLVESTAESITTAFRTIQGTSTAAVVSVTRAVRTNAVRHGMRAISQAAPNARIKGREIGRTIVARPSATPAAHIA